VLGLFVTSHLPTAPAVTGATRGTLERLPRSERLFIFVYMTSLPDDRTARARIRDEALALFAERGPDAVTVRDIAAVAKVSPALVVRHYGSKDGLRTAVDDHVVQVLEILLAQATEPPVGDALDLAALPTLADMVARSLPAGSPIPAYLGRLLLTHGPVGSALFRKLYAVARDALEGMAGAGSADRGEDPAVRAAFLLANDLAVLILRTHLHDVLGVDPLSVAGTRRWGAEVLSIYHNGLGGDLHRH